MPITWQSGGGDSVAAAAEGPGLVFKSMPIALSQMHGSTLLTILFFGMPAIFLPPVLDMIFRGRGDTRTPLLVNIAGFWLLGFPVGIWLCLEADLILNIGSRFDDRITGKLSEFAPRAKFIHIDVDPAEHSKIVDADIVVEGQWTEHSPAAYADAGATWWIEEMFSGSGEAVAERLRLGPPG